MQPVPNDAADVAPAPVPAQPLAVSEVRSADRGVPLRVTTMAIPATTAPLEQNVSGRDGRRIFAFRPVHRPQVTGQLLNLTG